MKTASKLFILFLAMVGGAVSVVAQGTTFQYQGRLNQNDAPVTGLYDLRFTLFDSSGGSTVVGTPQPRPATGVTNGLFLVTLDFGVGIFTGPARWLEIGVRSAGSASYTNLSPRQPMLPTPYAIHAGSASNVANGSVVKSLNNLRDNVTLAAGANVTLTPSGNTLTIASAGGGMSSPWLVNGNSAYYNAGNVGVGTTTPARRLTIRTPTLDYGLEHTDDDIRLNTFVGRSSGWLGTVSNHKLTFFANDNGFPNMTMTLDTGGRVGIGTDSPVTTLDVRGSLTLANDLFVNGNVGIGTTTPTSRLEIIGQDALKVSGFAPFITLRDTDPNLFRLRPRTMIQNSGGDLYIYGENYLDGDGAAFFKLAGNGNLGIGTFTPSAKLDVNGTTRTKILTITGGADIAEPFKMTSPEIAKGSVVVIDEQNAGQLKLSTEPYDTRVAGILSGANGINPGISLHQEGAIEGGENVALSGRVYVQADASHGAIKPGDLLTTSGTPGHAMKVADHAKAQGAILGKAMSGLKEGKGMVLVLVTLQ